MELDITLHKKQKKANLNVGYSCNSHCIFCRQGKYEKGEWSHDKTTAEIKQEMRKVIKSCQGIVFTGGEPTIRPDFMEIVKYAKTIGFETIQIHTNGRMFAYLDYCQKTIEAGANEFYLALHGHNPELHDFLTGAKGSFQQTVHGIRNLKKLKQEVITNTVITKYNYCHLPEIAELLISLGVDQYQFSFICPQGSTFGNFEEIFLRMKQIEPFSKRGMELGIRAGKIVETELAPFCFMQGCGNINGNVEVETEMTGRKSQLANAYNEDGKWRRKAVFPKCEQCGNDHLCKDFWKGFSKKGKKKEFIRVIPEKGRKEIRLSNKCLEINQARKALKSYEFNKKKIEYVNKITGSPINLDNYDYATYFLFKKFPVDSVGSSIKILDVGCFVGLFVNFLKKIGYKNVYGIEKTKDFVKAANKIGISVLRLDALDLSNRFPERYFDFISFIQVFHNDYSKPQAEIDHYILDIFIEARKVLKKDAFIFCNCFIEMPLRKIRKIGFEIVKVDLIGKYNYIFQRMD